MKDFKPISLLGRVQKLAAELLAERRKKVIDKLIAANWSAFIKGRQITDATWVGNEVMNTSLCKLVMFIKSYGTNEYINDYSELSIVYQQSDFQSLSMGLQRLFKIQILEMVEAQ